jgi:hypothetical protein
VPSPIFLWPPGRLHRCSPVENVPLTLCAFRRAPPAPEPALHVIAHELVTVIKGNVTSTGCIATRRGQTSAGTFIVPSEGTGIRRISKTRRCKTCRSRPNCCLLIGQLHNRGLGRRYTTHGRPSGGRTDGRTFVPLDRARDLRDSLKEALPPFFSVKGEGFHLAISFDAFGRIYVLEHDNLRLPR